MAVTFEIIENNKDKILGELDEAIDRALEALGLQAENYAKVHMEGHIDTGLLRNSITHARGGKPAAIKSYHAGNAGGAMLKGGKVVKKKNITSGASMGVGYYTGTAPNEENTMFVGTNVEYAPYVEFGHRLPSGGQVPGAHFLQQAIENHTSEYKKLIEQALKGF